MGCEFQESTAYLRPPSTTCHVTQETKFGHLIFHINNTVIFHVNECLLYGVVSTAVYFDPKRLYSMVLSRD